jgi:hypothetical protein
MRRSLALTSRWFRSRNGPSEIFNSQFNGALSRAPRTPRDDHAQPASGQSAPHISEHDAPRDDVFTRSVKTTKGSVRLTRQWLHDQLHIGPSRLATATSRTNEQTERSALLRRQLQSPVLPRVELPQRGPDRRDRRRAEGLIEGPQFVRRIGRLHDQELPAIDSPSDRRRGIKLPQPIDDHDHSPFAGRLSSREPGERSRTAAGMLREPLDERTPLPTAPWQDGIEGRTTAAEDSATGKLRVWRRAPCRRGRQLLAERGNEGLAGRGRWGTGHVLAPPADTIHLYRTGVNSNCGRSSHCGRLPVYFRFREWAPS